jgi:hypothetical protein
MVLRMKRSGGILGLLALVFVFSCEKEPLLIACDDCTASIPVDANITIKLDWVRDNSTVMYKVFLGNLEDNILIRSSFSTSNEASVSLPVNKKYTITAEYMLQDGVYITVDSVYPKVGFNKEQCDDPCYYVYDKTANLRLKHQ